MKVKELIAHLQKFEQEDEILISGDPEGNDYRTIEGVYRHTQDSEAVENPKDYIVIYPTDDIIDN